MAPQNGDPDFVWAPGTLTLEDLHRSKNIIVLHPVPTTDPNDPLNWLKWRKTLNFTLVSYYVLWTFVQLDIGFTAWGPIIEELGFSIDTLNAAAAVNYGGLAIGCIFFIPFIHKIGRRPLYIFSVALQFAACIWQAQAYNKGDLIGSNLVSGLGGAISETIVQVTIADMFFVHQHAGMNALYLAFSTIGAFLGPVASGYVVQSQGWRWIWWWCVIFLGVNLVVVIFFFEESKYIPLITARRGSATHPETTVSSQSTKEAIQPPDSKQPPLDIREAESATTTSSYSSTSNHALPTTIKTDPSIPQKSYRERLAFFTLTPERFTQHFYEPVLVLFTFPAVTYTAITYGATLAWFAIMTSVQATYLIAPPYNFSAIGIGLMNLPPFIGSIFGFFVGGWLNDLSIIWLSKRNKGIYEPEMRLWMVLPVIPILPAGILMFGLGLANGSPWIVLAIGYGLFGFGFVTCCAISLAYCTDCYQDIIASALVGVVFTRNILSVVVLFTITPWITGMGVQNLHILTACLAFAVLLLPAIMLKWGKRFRVKSARRYERMARRVGTSRTFD